MSIIEQAKAELAAINFGEEDSAVMIELLEKFLSTWDSGGAVAAAQPVFNRLLAGKPLSPLTGEDSEWVKCVDGVFQNKRASSVFKDPRFYDGELAYDIDAAEPRAAITFPYWPERDRVAMPVMTF